MDKIKVELLRHREDKKNAIDAILRLLDRKRTDGEVSPWETGAEDVLLQIKEEIIESPNAIIISGEKHYKPVKLECINDNIRDKVEKLKYIKSPEIAFGRTRFFREYKGWGDTVCISFILKGSRYSAHFHHRRECDGVHIWRYPDTISRRKNRKEIEEELGYIIKLIEPIIIDI